MNPGFLSLGCGDLMLLMLGIMAGDSATQSEDDGRKVLHYHQYLMEKLTLFKSDFFEGPKTLLSKQI